MTEAEWLSSTDPTAMLEFLRGKASDRKLQLFACGCARAIWENLPSRDKQEVQVFEAFVDGSNEMPRRLAPLGGKKSWNRYVPLPDFTRWGWGGDLTERVSRAASVCAKIHTSHPRTSNAPVDGRCERDIQANQMRCIFNPFHPVTLDPHWQTSTVLALAQGIYTERAFDRLPILADGLADAGCENPDLLNHCRSEGPHTRGCFAIDLLLNRE